MTRFLVGSYRIQRTKIEREIKFLFSSYFQIFCGLVYLRIVESFDRLAYFLICLANICAYF